MKITNQQLKQIIKEELNKVVNETDRDRSVSSELDAYLDRYYLKGKLDTPNGFIFTDDEIRYYSVEIDVTRDLLAKDLPLTDIIQTMLEYYPEINIGRFRAILQYIVNSR